MSNHLLTGFELLLMITFSQTGGRGRIRTDERTKRADLQSASFSHLDTLPARNGQIMLYA